MLYEPHKCVACEAKQMSQIVDQQASFDVGLRNLISQWPGSYSSARKLLLLIYKGGVYWWSKNSYQKIFMTQI